jgi:integrase
MRVSEALDLQLDDVLPEGILRIHRTKFGKSRLVPLHPTAVEALDLYLGRRRRVATTDSHLFISASSRRITSSIVNYTFRRLVRLAGITTQRRRPPRIHDLRHTFATRVLEQCAARGDTVSQHLVALSTYLGHTDFKSTYWYLEATPELMTDIATLAESWVAGRRTAASNDIMAFLVRDPGMAIGQGPKGRKDPPERNRRETPVFEMPPSISTLRGQIRIPA